jgi:hypothetical protein
MPRASAFISSRFDLEAAEIGGGEDAVGSDLQLLRYRVLVGRCASTHLVLLASQEICNRILVRFWLCVSLMRQEPLYTTPSEGPTG